MRKVLLEAAQSFRGSSTPNDIDAAVDDGVRHYNLLTFLSQGFAHHVKPDFDAFMRSEEEKSGDAPSTLDGPTKTHERVARYLENLARRLRTADLDDGFLIPDHWSQYDSWKWPKNTYS